MSTKKAIYKELKTISATTGRPLPRWIGSTKEQLATYLKQAKAPVRPQEKKAPPAQARPAILRDEKKQATEIKRALPFESKYEKDTPARPQRPRNFKLQEKKRPPVPARRLTRAQEEDIRRFDLERNMKIGRQYRANFNREIKEATYKFPQVTDKIHKSTREKVGKTVKFLGTNIPLVEEGDGNFVASVDRILEESLTRLQTALNSYKRLGGQEEKFNMVWTVETYEKNDDGDIETIIETISTVSTGDIERFERDARKKFLALFDDYGDIDGQIIEIRVNIWNYKIPETLGSNARAIQNIYNKYITVSSSTKKNCLYTSLAVIKNHERNPELLEITERGAYLRKEAGRSLKREIKGVSEGLANHDDIQKCSDYLRRDIKLYDNKFSILKEFKTARPVARSREAYEIQATRGHCIAMIKRNDTNRTKANIYDGDEEEQKALTELLGATPQRPERLEDVLITARKRPQLFNYKVATYDIETHRDADGIHRPHYLGIAKYEYEFKTEEKKTFRKVKSKGKKNFGKITQKEGTIKILTPSKKKEWYKLFRGFECIHDFINYLYENRAMYNGFVFYAHNGAKFDFRLIFNTLLGSNFSFDTSAFVETNGGIISAGFISYDEEGNKCTIRFLDSYRLLPASLKKLCMDFKTPHQKLDGTIDHETVTRENCLLDPLLEPYLINDVLGLLEVIDIFGREVYEDRKLDISTCLTGASLSKKLFFTNYYNPDNYPLYTMSDEHDIFIRSGYNGGRVECNFIGEIKGPVYYYDFTSLYPDVGRSLLPYGKPVEYDFSKEIKTTQFLYINATNADRTKTITDKLTVIGAELGKPFFRQTEAFQTEYKILAQERIRILSNDNIEFLNNMRITIIEAEEITDNIILDDNKEPHRPGQLPQGFFGFVEADIRTKDRTAIPVHSIKNEGRLIFPVFENWTRLTGVFTPEINTDIYEYKFIRGLKFKAGSFLKKFFNDCFIKKAQAKEQGKLALSNAYKIIANSGYGFFGLKYRGVDGIEITKTEDHAYRLYLHNDTLINWTTHGKIDINRVKKDLTVTNFNVGVASAIASYARLKLWRCMTDINKAGGRVYYLDTDSIITDLNFSKYPDLMNVYIPDGVGDDLGTLKNEAVEKVQKLGLTKQQTENIRLTEGGQIYFDSVILTGLKQYALYKNLNYEGKDHRIEIVKLKGYNQSKKALVYDDMKKIANGETLEQTATQWLSGKNTFLDEYDPFTITNRDIKKRFKRVYTKGKVLDNGKVVPLNI